MAALPPAPNILKFVFKGHNIDTDWVNILHFSYETTAPTSPELNTMATTALAAWASDIMPHVGAASSVDQLEITDLTSDTAARGLAIGTTPGTLSGGEITSQAATLVNYGIARRYRGGHPRSYLPPPTVGVMADSSHWTPAFVAAVNTAMQSFVSAVEAAGWTGSGTILFVNLSYFSGNAVRVDPVVDAITGISTSLVVATQRRRVGGR